MKKAVWLSFDLGLKGDYQGFYTWLDKNNARECGDNFAFIKKECNDDVFDMIKKELSEEIELRNDDRIYLVYRDKEGKIKGKFLNGRRKPAPWEGYFIEMDEGEEDY